MPKTQQVEHPTSKADVFAALNSAKGGAVEEGNVGGGTGMIAYTFKGGIGTASRVVGSGDQRYTVGVLVQADHGNRDELRIAGLPMGRMIDGAWPSQKGVVVFGPDAGKTVAMPEKNSLLIVIATDAPLQAHQLERLARRARLGLGRTGSTAGNLSGEFSLAFSTTNILSIDGSPAMQAAPISDLDDEVMNSLFAATVQAVEEALANQLVASETMTGMDDVTGYGLPHDQLADIFRGAR
ncbi:MAG: P1 family peptidase [Alphaproteobacteria bacterium]|nr:P1 family peptidase [Alphaproteobacteria bacterium]